MAERYAKAKAAGSLSKGQCEEFAKDFTKVYKDHGKQMTVAYFNAGAVWDECGETQKAEETYIAVTKAVAAFFTKSSSEVLAVRPRPSKP